MGTSRATLAQIYGAVSLVLMRGVHESCPYMRTLMSWTDGYGSWRLCLTNESLACLYDGGHYCSGTQSTCWEFGYGCAAEPTVGGSLEWDAGDMG